MLIPGTTTESIAANIATLIRAGCAPEQAAAIATLYAGGADLAAGIAYVCGDRVLMLMRGADCDHPFTWAFPGGKIEEGETPEQAAIRESQEEIGRAPSEPLRLIDWSEGFTTFACTVAEQFLPVLNPEHVGFAWVPLSMVTGSVSLPLHPGCCVTLQRAPLMPPTVALDERLIDGNGWFEVKDNPLSKVGVFPYLGSQLGKTGTDAGRVFQVYRPEEELSDPACVDSFRLIPWVDEHTLLGPVMQEVSSTAVPAEAKGVQGVIGQDVYYADGYLRGNLKAFSSTLAALISAGKRELSAGYSCVYDWTPGVWNGMQYDAIQRKIRGNHIATVKQGRMGPDVAVMDSFDFDPTEARNMADTTKTEEGGDGSKAMSLEDISAAIKAFQPIAAQVAEMQAALAKMSAPATAEAEPDAAVDKDVAAATPATAPPAMDEAAVIKRIAKRDTLAAKLKPIVGTFDHAEMTLADVVSYGIEKLGIKADKGSEAFALDGYLQARSTSTPPARVASAQDSATSADCPVLSYATQK